MPSWSSRFLTNTASRSATLGSGLAAFDDPLRQPLPSQPPQQDSHGRVTPIPRISSISRLEQLLSRPSHEHWRQHGRSSSHPFPSLFRRKSANDTTAGFGVDSSSEDEKTVARAGPGVPKLRRKPVSSAKPALEEAESETGHCMTCNSKVKWPRGIRCFRCTTCLTVNDLDPLGRPRREAGFSRNDNAPNLVKSDSNPASMPHKRALPISIERTATVISLCISNHMQNLQHFASESGHYELDERLHFVDRGFSSSEVGEHAVGPTPVLSSLSDLSQQNSAASFAQIPNHFSSNGAMSSSSSAVPPYRMAEKSSRAGHFQYLQVPLENAVDTGVASRETRRSVCAEKYRCEEARNIFKPLEDYISNTFGNFDSLNYSFYKGTPPATGRTRSESNLPMMERSGQQEGQIADLDAKTLLLGDFAENGSWWADDFGTSRVPRHKPSKHVCRWVTSKSAQIDWDQVCRWYDLLLYAGCNWQHFLSNTSAHESVEYKGLGNGSLAALESEFKAARDHLHSHILKVAEKLLKRPGRRIDDPDFLRFLLILLANPLLQPCRSSSRNLRSPNNDLDKTERHMNAVTLCRGREASVSNRTHHHQVGVLKRILGLMSNTPPECKRYLVSWLSREPEKLLQDNIELVGNFVTHRLTRPLKPRSNTVGPIDGSLIPYINTSYADTSAQLHSALGVSGSRKASKRDESNKVELSYGDDWQMRAAARVMALLFAANNNYFARRPTNLYASATETEQMSSGLVAKMKARAHGQLLPTSDFYNTLLDYKDLVADFEEWEARRGKFCFCQFPFFLSLGSKIRILEHDARRQMEVKAREALFHSIMSNNRTLEQHLNLKVRRDCLVEDSLQAISESVAVGQNEIKKGLKVQFVGEEGVDVGGLRKEWFLLLVREVFDPNHGMFVYDEDSNFCYFNPFSFETSDQYFLTGAVIGLAIYNSTILDIALPPFTFKKLLASAPGASNGRLNFTLDDLAEYRPALAKGLRQLLEYEGEVESTFCYDFVAPISRYGCVEYAPLFPGGEHVPVTNENRREFVDAYVNYLLDTSVARQFDPFKRGFFTVCGGNALSLFRPEEIELLVRGSDEPLDVASLRAVAVYEGWTLHDRPIDHADDAGIPVVRAFWDFFHNISPGGQRRMLGWITGSDRIPATGAANLIIRIACAGPDCERFPVARTCFNKLLLYEYSSRQKLHEKLWRAVTESEGFGLK